MFGLDLGFGVFKYSLSLSLASEFLLWFLGLPGGSLFFDFGFFF